VRGDDNRWQDSTTKPSLIARYTSFKPGHDLLT
jgi:hypothetical protein